MRRRLRKFLPIVLIAVLVQIFAPIGATWAASIAASDPLHVAAICHGNATPNQTDQSGQPRAHDCCSICNVVHTGGPVATPQAAVATPWRHAARVTWLDAAPDLFISRAGSHAQARAPPLLT
jgi:hypothetical protein